MSKRSWWGLAILCGLMGCRGEEEVRAYRVPKTEGAVPARAAVSVAGPRDKPEETMPASPSPSPPGQATDRMLAALVSRGSADWSFKMLGPAEIVRKHEEAFRGLIQSLTFDDSGEPQWELPKGWQALPKSGMRFATLRPVPDESVAEVSVISLPTQNRLENLNRWRNQLQLPPVEAAQLEELISQIPLQQGNADWMVMDGRAAQDRITGPMTSGGTPVPPRAPAAASSVSRDEPTREPGDFAWVQVEDGLLNFEAPSTWQDAPPGPMRRMLFSLDRDGQRIEVSISTLAEQGSAVAPNVNRWLGQISQPTLNDAELKELLQKRTVDGIESTYVELGSAEGAKRILAAITIHEGKGWFFKLMGDRELADATRNDFLRFLDSVKFKD